jgi:hypothetical protein
MRPGLTLFHIIFAGLNLHALNMADMRALYQHVRSLNAKGEAMPAYVPPGQAPATPYFQLTLSGSVPPAPTTRS